MATERITTPVLTDSTGINIVTALQAIANALIGVGVKAVTVIPTATESLVGEVYLLTDVQAGYTQGRVYRCIEVEQSDPAEYEWIDLSAMMGFVTNAVNNLTNYYLKTELYTKTEVDAIVTAIKNSRFEVVSELPTSGIKTNVIYLVPKSTSQTNNAKDEYINLDGTSAGWEKIGDTEIDLSGYVTTTALNTILADYITSNGLTTILSDYATNASVATLLASKTNQDDFSTLASDYFNRNGMKNLAKLTATSGSMTGITFTRNSDGTITINGTNTSPSVAYFIAMEVEQNYFKPGKYTLSCVGHDVSMTIHLRYNTGSNVDLAIIDSTTPTTDFEITQAIIDSAVNGFNLVIYVGSGATVSNVVISPMIRIAGLSDSSFKAYAPTNEELNEELEELSTNVVHKTGTEYISGEKTFTDRITLTDTRKTPRLYISGEGAEIQGDMGSLKIRSVSGNDPIQIISESGGNINIEASKDLDDDVAKINLTAADGVHVNDTLTVGGDIDASGVIVSDSSTGITASGNPINIPDALPTDLKSCVVGIEPIQDLHGYDKPWIGGAGKNLLPMTVTRIKAANTIGTWSENVYTLYGVTFTLLTDSDGNITGIKANGTAAAQIQFNLYSGNNGAYQSNIFKNMLFNGSTQDSSISTFSLLVQYSNDGTSWVDEQFQTTSAITIKSDYDYVRVQIIIKNGNAISNKIFYPMIRSAFNADPTFKPYTNICPISGIDSVKVERNGINIWDEEWEQGQYGIETGEKAPSDYHIRCKNPIPVKPNTEYFYSTNGFNINVCYMDANMGFLGNFNSVHDVKITTPDNCYYIVFNMARAYGLTYNHDISINYPSTATQYEPYQSKTTTIPLGQTVYGGTLDVKSGVLTVDRVFVEYDGSSDEAWSFHGSGSASAYAMKIVAPSLFNADIRPISNYASGLTYNDTYGDYYCFVSVSDGNNFIAGKQDITTVADWKAYLAEHPLQVCYKLATPTTIQLTPHEISLLKGTNVITVNGNTIIDVEYHPDIVPYVDGKIEEVLTETDQNYIKQNGSQTVDTFLTNDGGWFKVQDNNQEVLFWENGICKMGSSAFPLCITIDDDSAASCFQIGRDGHTSGGTNNPQIAMIIVPESATGGDGQVKINGTLTVNGIPFRPIFEGTKAQWNALSSTNKAKYDIVILTDD